MTCEYKVFNENGSLVDCGKKCTSVVVPNNKYLKKFGLHGRIFLCTEHLDFVKDAVDQRELWRYQSFLPNCEYCAKYTLIYNDNNSDAFCTMGKSNLFNWPFKHTKCKYFKEKEK